MVAIAEASLTRRTFPLPPSLSLQLLAVAGPPYDTLEEVIGTRGTAGHGSLKEFGVHYRCLPVSCDT